MESTRNKRGLGFTLIEVLVVVAIIAVLAAVVMPVFAQAKASGKKAADTAQLSQVSKACLMYVIDYDGGYPMLFDYIPPGQTDPDNFGFNRWPWLLRPYAKSFDLFVSPADAKHAELRSKQSKDFGYLFGLLPSWGYNGHYFSPGVDPYLRDQHPFAPISESQVTHPSETLVFASSTWYTAPRKGLPPDKPDIGYFRLYPPKQWQGSPPLTGLSYGHVWPRHHGVTANVAFADGSVKAMRITQIQTEELWISEK